MLQTQHNYFTKGIYLISTLVYNLCNAGITPCSALYSWTT